MILDDIRIAIIGLGYVGLPLAVAFGRKLYVLGFDIDQSRIEELDTGRDRTREIDSEELADAKFLLFSSDQRNLCSCNFYIVTVPTPIDSHNQPNLTPLLSATKTVGSVLKKGDIVVFESTVYPGVTEDECVPVLELESGLIFNQDFFVGYSPERINPGDKLHRISDICKVTSGSTPQIAEFVDQVYKKVITAGTYKAESIKIAEAAKVIENTQRDLNIALVNELAMLFNKLDIDTDSVLRAAGSKWNFLPFQPGLVGGHCIGVDPFYLTHKAQSVGYDPQVILAGRRVNEGMADYVVSQLVKKMIIKGVRLNDANILVMGLTFKENCPDLRNTKIIDIMIGLRDYGFSVSCHDPVAVPVEAKKLYQVELVSDLGSVSYDAVIFAVAHDQFLELNERDVAAFLRPNGVVYDLKNILPVGIADLRL